MNKKKLFFRILNSQKNVKFNEFISTLELFNFNLARVSGSHHIFYHEGIKEFINIQNVKGEVKPYQVKQFLKIVEKHNLSME